MSATKPIGRASWTMLGQKKHGCSWSPKTWKKFTILKKQPPPGQGRNTYTLHQQRSNGVVVTGPGRSRMNDSPYSRTPTMPLQGPNGASLPLPDFVEKRLFSSTPQQKSLTIDNINQNVRKAKYAVRGELAVKSEEYRAKLQKGEGKDLPFDSVISANIGNPQQLDQKPITFFRQVASIMENPELLEKEAVLSKELGYEKDVFERARKLLADVKSVGAYSQSQGAPGIRQSVADFIERRDGYSA
ncbi:hypothetical protein KC365_g18229, partial [Hortaea werneckii]